MSDDRFKQSPPPFDHHGGSGGEFDEEEKTQLVDLESLQSGGAEPQFAPPPTMDSGPPPHMDGDDATQLFEIPPSMDDHDGITSSAPDFGSSPAPPIPGGQYDSGPIGGGIGGQDPYGGGQASYGGADYGGDQVVIGDGNDYSQDEATQFVNINDFAEQPAHFTPEQEAAGYDGNTQFVDVNALMAGGGPASPGEQINNDQELHRGYHFQAGDIHHGEITLIHAQNQLGKPVVLKRVWEDDPQAMTTPLRQRIAQLHELKHPNLLAMNGMFVTSSGMWVEIDAPAGQRLTAIIEGRGAHPPEMVIPWMEKVAHVLETIHSNQLAYANLTTDAVWISDDGQVKVEPFDMLRFENRGNLGVFGPPEMNAPPEQRQLSPASDVFSLAAVTAAAVTGLPLRNEALVQLEDKKLSQALLKGLSQPPQERQQTAGELIDELKGGGLDIKIVGGGAAAAMLLIIIVLSVITGGDDDVAPPPPQGDEAMAEAAADEPLPQDQAAPEGEAQEASAAPVDLPAQISTDPRLTISTSFKLNPPATSNQNATDDQLQTWRQEARDLVEEAEGKSSRSDKYEHYASALERLAYVIRSQDEAPEEDWEAWREIYENSVVQSQLEELYKAFYEPLLEGRLGTAARRYGRIARINPQANAEDFLRGHHSADIVAIGDGHEENDDD